LYYDLMTPSQADSDAERESVMRAMAEGLPTRLNAPATAARILVGQRVCEDDPSNYAVKSWPDAVWLMFPLEYEVNRNCPQDIRTEEGQLLTPELWPREAVERMKLGLQGRTKDEPGLSSFAVAALLAQSPVPRGGGVIAIDDWMCWPPDGEPAPENLTRDPSGQIRLLLPEFIVDEAGRPLVLVAVDTAFKETETADYNAVVVLACFGRRREEVSRARPWMSDRWGSSEHDPAEDEGHTVATQQTRVVLPRHFNSGHH